MHGYNPASWDEGGCHVEHNAVAATFTALLVTGIAISYLPQHYRIISKRSGEGFSPWFLLLGSVSSASVMLNVIAKQWGTIKCCRVVSAGACVESLGAVFQVLVVWSFFTFILVLYMVYFPEHLKFAEVDVPGLGAGTPIHIKTRVKTDEWRLAITLSWVVALHIVLITFVTFLLIGTKPGSDTLDIWTGFLGLLSAACAVVQYGPQLAHTWNSKVVGALSIPMMCIQTPGAVAMVISIAIRPDTDWTSWATFAVAGVMQGVLLAMCIVWKARQTRLGIDDFGNPIVRDGAHETSPLLRNDQ
ncbi:hypothetical protein BKA62DRAFT_702492 [Auriculariales sp. MPI-PUGE-AT-0066]|nr:hypothetical protein BKA62DRAFT_702492 [Auriculariales sp. MPI-PUGE-AT-0066]